MGIGGVAIVIAAFLILFGIPQWVSTPSNVHKLVLSPLFWPYIVAVLTGVIGLGLVVRSLMMAPAPADQSGPNYAEARSASLRLVILAVMMVIYMLAMNTVGMVWASMLAFVGVAFLVKTHHPKTAVIAAIVIPLLLYAFFAHVASVAIPQGIFVRLP